MKILNKFIWSKKEPSNKNDIWFDGSTWRMYTEEAWQSFTLPVDAADKVAKVIENVSEVYQEKLNAGYGIIIEGNTISVDDSILYDDSDVWEAIETLQQNKVEQIQLNDYVPLDRYVSTSQVLMDNISELNSTKADKTKTERELNKKLNKTDVATINGQSLTEGGNIVINDTEIKQQLTELSEELASNGVLIEDLQNTKIDKEADDYYPQLSVGVADNLAGVDEVARVINFGQSGGGAISDGVARIERIKGNSLVWNQSVDNTLDTSLLKFRASSGASLSIEDNAFKLTISGTGSQYAYYRTEPFIAHLVAGHKYCVALEAKASAARKCVVAISGASGVAINKSLASNMWTRLNTIATISAVSSSTPYLSIGLTDAASGDVVYFKNVQVIDLTLMFGSGNEPTTIEQFYQRTPYGVDLFAYNEGEVIHMDVQSIESVGVNQWDEEWEIGGLSANGLPVEATNRIRSKNYIPVVPHKTYYVSKALVVFYYDIDYNIISYEAIDAGVPPIPSNCYYLKFYEYGTTTYKGDICINISDTSLNGKYFPYIKRVEDLAVIRKYFPQGMKSAPTAHDAIRYNKASGKWEKVEATGIRAYQEGDADNASYLTDGKVTCYPLAEPIVTELDEADQFKDLDYQVWNAGTEKAIAEGKSAPLAADITYGFNAIGKIKELESLVAALRAKVGI